MHDASHPDLTVILEMDMHIMENIQVDPIWVEQPNDISWYLGRISKLHGPGFAGLVIAS
jgi:hypothetical protein